MLGALAFTVQSPVLLLAIGCIVSIGNIGLGRWVQRHHRSVVHYQRIEWCRLVFNLINECVVIAWLGHEAPVWCLALPGALAFSVIWRGRVVVVAYAVHLVTLTLCMVLTGQSGGQILLMIGTYSLCAHMTVHLMHEIRSAIQAREDSARIALQLQEDRLKEDLANQRRSALASAGQLAAGIAHEVNNPLFAVLGNLSFINDNWKRASRGTDPEIERELRHAIADTQSAASSISSIIESMTSFGRARAEKLEKLDDMGPVIDEALRLINPRLDPKTEVTRHLGESATILAGRSTITQIVVNLVLNANAAISATRGPGTVSVRTFSDRFGRAILEVSDTGTGIDEEDLAHIFTPFFTTSPGRSSGLGLPIVHDLVDALHGRIEVQTAQGEGTTFTVRIPAASQVGHRVRPIDAALSPE